MSGLDNNDDAPALEQIEDEIADLSGRILEGRYRLIELIGQGGMGSVYRAEHVTIRREVAVKVLHTNLAQLPELARRFEREAFAIGRINHPHCIDVMDFGKLEDGSLYLVMEFVEGKTLADLVQYEGAVAPVRAFRIIRQVVRGLRHAHRAGIVHRDVKPENVILTARDDEPEFAKVLDFGIAKLVGEAADGDNVNLTQAGVAFGTPTYLSPEQALGEESTPASDLYSTTAMLFELIAGRPPFVSDDKLSLLGKHATLDPPRLADVCDTPVPEVVEAFIARGLAKRPTDRFADDDACIAALDNCLMALGAPRMGATGDFTPVPGQTKAIAARLSGNRLSGNRWLIYAGGGALAVLVALVIALSADGEDKAESEEGPLAEIAAAGGEPGAAEEAAEALSKGDPEKTIQLLEAGGEEVEGDARAQLQLGHAYASKSEYDAALQAYGRALAIDGGLAGDDTMNANLWVLLDDDGAILVEAAALLLTYNSDDRIRARVIELAKHERQPVRMKAMALAESAGMSDEIDRLAAYSLDLVQGKNCSDRREAVAKLRALGDPAAIPALQKAKNRTNGRRWRRRKVNKCLIAAADDAIGFLKNLEGGE